MRKQTPATKTDITRMAANIDAKFDRLAAMLGDRFAKVDAKIDAVNKRLALGILQANDRTDRLEAKMEERFREATGKIERMSGLVESAHRAMIIHGRILTEHDRRLGALEARA